MREHEQFCKLRGTGIQVGRTDLGCACLRLFQIRQHELRRIIRILKKELATYDDYVALVLKPKDPWEEALEKDAEVLAGAWDDLLRAAISLTADTIYQLDGDRETYLECILFAAMRVRAMAPEGTAWDDPQPTEPGLERSALRAVLRALIKADNCHEAAHDNTVPSLLVADALLHGLWLASKEGGNG
jgi:hypothetical protein